MPTPMLLSQRGDLKVWPHRLALGKPVVRNIYIGESAERWIKDELKNLQTDGFHHGAERPREQLADVFRRVMVGEHINKFRPKTLWAHPNWMHELRTADLRIFGWFWRSTDFIVSEIVAKSALSAKRITYHGCLELCRAHRERLDLDPPKFIEGEINDILGF